MVLIEVGPTKTPFQVHRNLLVKASKFFDAAFRVDENGDGVFKEATEKTMELPDETPQMFGYFTHWLYSGKCPPLPIDVFEERESTFRKFVDLYLFGDKYDIAHLRYSTCLAIIDMVAPEQHDHTSTTFKAPTLEAATWAWARVAETSPIRQILIRYCTRNHKSTWMNDQNEAYKLQPCPDFAIELLRAVCHGVTYYTNDDFRNLVPEPDRRQ